MDMDRRLFLALALANTLVLFTTPTQWVVVRNAMTQTNI